MNEDQPPTHLTLSRRRAVLGNGGVLTAAGIHSQVTTEATHEQALSFTVLSDAGEQQIYEFELTAEKFDWELMAGVSPRGWGDNGQTPGPELRVREGDLVRITLRNRLSVPTTWAGSAPF